MSVKAGDRARVIGPTGQLPTAIVQVNSLCPDDDYVDGPVWHCTNLSSCLAPTMSFVTPIGTFLFNWHVAPAGSHLHLPEKYLVKLPDVDDNEEDTVDTTLPKEVVYG